MKNSFRKTFSILCAVSMLLSPMPTTSLAGEEFPETDGIQTQQETPQVQGGQEDPNDGEVSPVVSVNLVTGEETITPETPKEPEAPDASQQDRDASDDAVAPADCADPDAAADQDGAANQDGAVDQSAPADAGADRGEGSIAPGAGEEEKKLPTFWLDQSISGKIRPRETKEVVLHADQSGKVLFTLTLRRDDEEDIDEKNPDIYVTFNGSGVAMTPVEDQTLVFTFTRKVHWNDDYTIALSSGLETGFTLRAEKLPAEQTEDKEETTVAETKDNAEETTGGNEEETTEDKAEETTEEITEENSDKVTEQKTEENAEKVPEQETGEQAETKTEEGTGEEKTAEETGDAGSTGNTGETGDTANQSGTTEETTEKAAEQSGTEEQTKVYNATDETGATAETNAAGETGENQETEEQAVTYAEDILQDPNGTMKLTGPDYTVIVKVTEEAGLPVGTRLNVREVKQGSFRYNGLTGMIDETLSEEGTRIDGFARLFDITFIYENEELEPLVPVNVQIIFADQIVSAEENKEIKTVHIDDDGSTEVINASDSGNAVAFSSDSFSIYAVVAAGYLTQTITAGSKRYKVTVEYSAETGIPLDGASLQVKEITEGSVLYDAYREKAAEAMGSDDADLVGLYDISILNKGEKIQPAEGTTVSVSIRPAEIMDAGEVQVVHFPQEAASAESIPDGEIVDSGNAGSNTVTFEADGFSVYALAYTVDYTYENKEYHMQGETSMLLSELFTRLGIQANTADVRNVEFTDESLLTIEKTGNDYTLTSLRPFTSNETLTVTMSDGTVYLIAVTDETNPANKNLNNFVTSVNIKQASTDENGNYIVIPDEPFSIVLRFDETRSLQFDNDGPLTYTLPEELSALPNQTGSLTLKVTDQDGNEIEVPNNTYSIQNGQLVFNWSSDPNIKYVRATNNTYFTIAFDCTVSENKTGVNFGNSITKNFVVSTENSVTSSKVSNIDYTNNKIKYTVNVQSSGTSQNVRLSDTLTGEGITLLQNSFSIRSTRDTQDTTQLTPAVNGNSFNLTIPVMKNNEIITVEYEAELHPELISKVDGKTIIHAKNGISVVSNGDNEGDNSSVENTIDYTPELYKSEGKLTSRTDESAILNWTITANANTSMPMAGNHVTDKISDASQSIMSYTGDGLTVVVTDAQYQEIGTYTIPWSSVKADAAKTWTYAFPNTVTLSNGTVIDNTTNAYRYAFKYSTIVDTTGSSSPIQVKNEASSDGKSAEGTGNITNEGGETARAQKTVEKVDLENEEVTWNFSFTVPKEGLNSAVVTDYLPMTWHEDGQQHIDPDNQYNIQNGHNIFDDFVPGSLSVEGTDGTETWTIETIPCTNDVNTNENNRARVLVTFYKNSVQTDENQGLNASNGERTIIITLKTRINQTWVNLAKTDSNRVNHENWATFNSIEAKKSTEIKGPELRKTVTPAGTRTVNGVELPIYKYELVLNGVTRTDMTISDQFDVSLLTPYTPTVTRNDGTIFTDWSKDPFVIKAGDQYYQGYRKYHPSEVDINNNPAPAAVSYLLTANGMNIVTSADNVPVGEKGIFYSTYVLTYYLTIKDEAALQRLSQMAANANDGKYNLINQATWNHQTSTGTVTYEYKGLDKKMLTAESELEKTDSDIYADFEITLNPSGAVLNNMEPMTMTDVFSGISILYDTITATPSNGVKWDFSGNSAIFTIPDATKVVITYRARVVFTSIGETGDQVQVTFSNTATLKGYHQTIEKTAKRTNNGEGGASSYAIKLLKYEAGNMTHRLQGAEFALYEINSDGSETPVLDKDIKPVKFTTDQNGLINVFGNQNTDGWSLYGGQKYSLKEIKAPNGYQLAGFDYEFTITTDGTTDYEHYIYHSGDTMSAKNYPGTDIKVRKVWSDGNSKHDSDSVTVKLQQRKKTGETTWSDWSDTIREEVKNGNSYQWQDTNGKTLELNKDNDWEGIFNSLPLTVPVNLDDLEGDDVAVEYRIVETLVNDEAPTEENVSIVKSTEGGAYVYTVTNTVSKGSLKLKKSVTVNGNPTTGKLADGTYTFTIQGPGTKTDTKTVTIAIEDGRTKSAKIDDQNATPDANGYVEVTDLEAGNYTITETGSTNDKTSLASATGGTSVSDQKVVTVTVTAGKNGTEVLPAGIATFTNNRDVGGLKIRKVVTENNGEPTAVTKALLAGEYVFTIYTNAQCTEPYQEDGRTVTITIGTDGQPVTSAEVSNMPTGDYWVKETGAPANGSAPKVNPVKVTVGAGQTGNTAVIAIVTNNIDLGSLKLKKSVTVNGNPTTGTLADGDYTFTVTGPGTSTSSKTVVIKIENGATKSATIDGKAVTPVNGFVEVTNLLAGNYTITETASGSDASFAKVEVNGTESTTNGATVTVTSGKTGSEVSAAGIATFTNNMERGSLEVKKTVTDNSGVEPAGQTYGIRIYSATSFRADGVTAKKNGTILDQKVETVAALDGTNYYTLTYYFAKNDVIVLENLKLGAYIVQEITTGDFTTTYSEDTSNVTVGTDRATVTLSQTGKTGKTTVNNKYTEYGSLKLKKTVTVNGSTPGKLADGTYEFEVKGPGTETTTRTVIVTIEDGTTESATIDGTPAILENGYVVIPNLKTGDYTVTETAPTNFTTLVSVSGGKSVTNKVATMTVTAQKAGDLVPEAGMATFTNNRDVGSLEVEKKVIDPDHRATDNIYHITVTTPGLIDEANLSVKMGDNAITPVLVKKYSGETLDHYEISFTIEGGKKVTLENLPLGNYVVQETTSGAHIFTSSYSGTSGSVTVTSSGATATVAKGTATGVEITNTYGAYGSLKLRKSVTVNGHPTEGTLADGTYTFSITGPNSYSGEVTVTIKDGEMFSADGGVSGTDGFVEVGNLPAGEYTIAETASTNASVILASAEGGKTVSTDKRVTVVVEAGKKAETVAVTGKATFTNNRDAGRIKIAKTVQVNGGAAGTGDYTLVDGDYTFEIYAKGTDGKATGDKLDTVTVTVSNGTAEPVVSNVDLAEGYYIVSEVTNNFRPGMSLTNGNDKPVHVTAGKTTAADIPNEGCASFTNEMKYADLKIGKIIEGNAKNSNDQFGFAVTLIFNGKPLSGTFAAVGTGSVSATTSVTFDKDGKAAITLKGGDTLTIKKLPDGATYTVTETNNCGYDSTNVTRKVGTATTQVDNTLSVNGTITGAAGKTYEEIFTNIKNKYGEINIQKKVTGNAASSDNNEYTIQVTLTDTSFNGPASLHGVEFKNGVATFKLKANESKTITHLDHGVGYTVTETSATPAKIEIKEGKDDSNPTSATFPQYVDSAKTGDKMQIVIVTNTFNQYGGLSVTKVVDSNETADNDTEFTFNVYLYPAITDNSPNTITYDENTFNLVQNAPDLDNPANRTAKAYSYTFTLKHGQEKEIKQIDVGMPYYIEETANNRFITTYSSQKGTIQASESPYHPVEANRITVTNELITGDMQVLKHFDGNMEDDTTEFPITITFGKNVSGKITRSGVQGEVPFSNTNAITVNLKNNQTATITGVEAGVSYTVTEPLDSTVYQGFTTPSITNGNGTISASTTQIVTVTNHKSGYGGLLIEKRVDGNDPYKKTWFAVTIELDDKTFSGTVWAHDSRGWFDLPFKNGVSAPHSKEPDANGNVPVNDAKYWMPKKTATISANAIAIKAVNSEGQEYAPLMIVGLPQGVKYTVIEDDYNGTYDTQTIVYQDTTRKIDALVFDNDETTIKSITADQLKTTDLVMVTNVRNRTGKLVLTKIIDGNDISESDEFTFTITSVPKIPAGTYSGVTFDSDGKAVVKLTGAGFADGITRETLHAYTTNGNGGKTLIIEGLPLRTVVTINETGTNGYTPTYDLVYRQKVESPTKEQTDEYELRNGKAWGSGDKISIKESDKNTATIDVDQRIFGIINTKNTYGDLKIHKAVAGNAGDKSKEFPFTLTIYKDEAHTTVDTSITGTHGDVTFTDGTTTFTVKDTNEISVTGLPNGAYYVLAETLTGDDATNYETTITAASGTVDNTARTVSGRIDGGEPGTNSEVLLSYTNTYEEKYAEQGLEILKAATGDGAPASLPSGAFKFKATSMSAPTGVTAPTYTDALNNGNKVTFSKAVFKAAGDYVYEISEESIDSTKLAGFPDVSTDKIYAKITVTKTGKVFNAGVKYYSDSGCRNQVTGEAIKITNTYKPTPTKYSPKATKSFNKDDRWPAQNFTFTLEQTGGKAMVLSASETKTVTKTDRKAVFSELTFSEAGTYLFAIRETIPAGADPTTHIFEGITYDATEHVLTVQVGDNGGALAVTEVKYDGTAYNATTAVTIADASATITNTYGANGTATIQATKALAEGDEGKWPTGGKAVFTIKANTDGAPMPAQADRNKTLTAPGDVTFGTLALTDSMAGKTYQYTISETTENFPQDGWSKSGNITVTLEVKDDGKGNLDGEVTYDPGNKTITNSYTAKGNAVFEVEKAIEQGDTWPNGAKATLTLAAETNGAPMPETDNDKTVQLEGKGKATFGTIKLEESMVGNEYKYTITETTEGFPNGWSNDGPITVTLKVADDTFGHLVPDISYSKNGVITNRYEAKGDTKIEVTKELAQGDQWPDGGRVTFTLAGEGDAPMPDTAGDAVQPLSAKGTATFGKITLQESMAGHTYHYTISETGSFGTDWHLPKTVTATLAVSDDGKGNLIGVVTYDPADKTIENKKVEWPTFEKKIKDKNDSAGTETDWQDSADYDIGDQVPYLLKATLADNVTDYETYHITFRDVMEQGLTFNDQSVTVKIGNGTAVAVPVGEKTDANVTYKLQKISAQAFDLTITWTGTAGARIADTSLNKAPVEVLFAAELNKNAVLGRKGNVNAAYLEYSSDYTTDTVTRKTQKDAVIAFTYKTEVSKVDPNGQPVDGAEFSLYKKIQGSDDKLIATIKNSAGTVFTFNGLDDGEYVLKETRIPIGYKPIEDIAFTVTANHAIVWNVEANPTDSIETLPGREEILTGLTGVQTGNIVAGVLSFTSQPTAEILTANVVNTPSTPPEFEKKIRDTNDTTGATTDWQDSADYDIGDDVPYKLTAKLADNVTDYRKYHITFHDTLEQGKLSYNGNASVEVIGANGNTITDGYTVTKTGSAGDNTFTVTLTWGDGTGKITDTNLNLATVNVYFTGKLLDGANLGAQGNINTAYLEYSNNPNVDSQGQPSEDTGRTEDDTVIAFTYKVEVSKTTEKDGQTVPLEGASFKLQKKLADGRLQDVALDANASNATTFSFRGLDDGVYVLTETKVPIGMKAIKPIEFTVTADHKIEWVLPTDVAKDPTKTAMARNEILENLSSEPVKLQLVSGDKESGTLALSKDQPITGLAGNVNNTPAEKPTFEKKILDVNDSEDEPIDYDNLPGATGWQDSADYDIGDKVPYELTAVTADNVTDYYRYFIKFHDKMEETLDFNADSMVVTVNGTKLADGKYAITKDADGHGFHLTVSWEGKAENGKIIEKIADTNANHATVKVYFTATLNEKANLGKHGNVNTSYLEYSNNQNLDQNGQPSNNTENTKKDAVIAFTYRTDITKTDENGKPLAGAEFKLVKLMKDGSEVTVDNVQVTDETVFSFIGLDDGDYELRETKAPEGYKPLPALPVTVKAGHAETWNVAADPTAGFDLPGRDTVLTSLNGNLGNGILLRNNRTDVLEGTADNTPIPVSAIIRKVWNDENNRDGLRPASLTFALMKTVEGKTTATGITATLSEKNNWTEIVSNLPSAEGGKLVSYSWSEPKVAGYELEDKIEDGALTVMINRHKPEETGTSVKKVWNDRNNEMKKRPDSITVQLYADGKAEGEAVTLNAANGWSHSWEHLKKNVRENGVTREIKYTVAETEIPDGYVSKVTGSAAKGYVITNTFDTGRLVIQKEFDIQVPPPEPEPEEKTTDIEVVKVWDDNNNADGNRPGSITVHLFAGGEEIKSRQLTAANGWRTKFGELPKFVDGHPIHYSVTEDPVEWYSTEIHGFTITNHYRPETMSVSVRKVWNDEHNKLGLRPKSVVMTLNNGTSVTLNAKNGWQATVTGLPTKINGQPAVYTWTEQSVLNYELESVTKQGGVTVFTNRLWTRPDEPSKGKKPKLPGQTLYVFDEYDTPLGVEIVINHVGDCFD